MNERYKNGKIYKLWRLDCDDVYIGSTCLPLTKRLYEHKKSFKLWDANPEKRGFVTSYLLFRKGIDDVKIELIMSCPCNDKSELLKNEGFYIRSIKCVNKHIPNRTKQEYAKNRYQRMKIYSKSILDQYAKNHKQYAKAYVERNKDEISCKSKLYRERNKDKLIESRKKYRENNLDKLKAHSAEKVKCSCGCFISRSNISQHKKSLKHQQSSSVSN